MKPEEQHGRENSVEFLGWLSHTFHGNMALDLVWLDDFD